MSKFKVGDLITDKMELYQVIAVSEISYTIKKIDENDVNKVPKHIVENNTIKYDLSKPLMKIVSDGVCRCSHCNKELYYGDNCVRNNGDVYCSGFCLVEAIAEDSVINENDLDDRNIIEKPLFDLSKEQIEEIKKVRKMI